MNTSENADFMFEPIDNRPDWLDELAEQVYQHTKVQVDCINRFYNPTNYAHVLATAYNHKVVTKLEGHKTLKVDVGVIAEQDARVLDGKDFGVKLSLPSGKSVVVALDFHPKCDVNFRNEKLDLTYYGKVLTSLVWHASEGAIPGFYFWKDVQGELCERDYLEHEGKEEERVFRNVHSVLD